MSDPERRMKVTRHLRIQCCIGWSSRMCSRITNQRESQREYREVEETWQPMRMWVHHSLTFSAPVTISR